MALLLPEENRSIGCCHKLFFKKKGFYFSDFHREIVSEMGELGVLGPTIKGKDKGRKSKELLFFADVLCLVIV